MKQVTKTEFDNWRAANPDMIAVPARICQPACTPFFEPGNIKPGSDVALIKWYDEEDPPSENKYFLKE